MTSVRRSSYYRELKFWGSVEGVENKESVEQKIKSHNGLQEQDIFRVVHLQEVTLRGYKAYNVHAEVSPHVFRKLTSSGRVYLEWLSYPVQEDLNVQRCYNCSGYGHIAKNCKRQRACMHCSLDHDSKTCTNQENPKCINCVRANEKGNAKRSVGHCANDTDKCEVLKWQKSLKRSKIDYGS